MPSREISSLILSLGVSLIALALLAWQCFDRANREDDLLPDDGTYFRRRDFRRVFVVVVMLLLAAGIYYGSHIDHRLNGRPNPWFLGIWLAVFWLVIVLSSTALIDWIATRRYARRHRNKMVREGLLILRDEMKARMEQAAREREIGGDNGHAGV